jgi:uncharacterized membrane protein YfcA
MSPTHAVFLVGAGLLAGLVGSAGGITSLISYPALLAVGIPRLPASVTNSVALVTIWPGSALGSRSELRGQAPWLRRWAPVTAAGGAVGAVLLLSTPPGVFSRIVPWLIAFASVTLLVQPWVASWSRGERSNQVVVGIGLFVVSFYGGYFGAGAGVMVLVLLLLAVDADLPRANALKNTILGVANVAAAIAFALFGPVAWIAAVLLSLGSFAGSIIGPSITRRVPGGLMRMVIAVAGLGLAVDLWVTRG